MITEITHPDYDAIYDDWGKFQSTYNGGDQFVSDYLEQFSDRESTADFDERKKLTYCSGHAKACINEIKNAIFQRLVDITRLGGPQSYQAAIKSNVDREFNTMNSFIGRRVLPQLLIKGKVAVYIDSPPMPDAVTMADTVGNSPYLYIYNAEDIRSWAYDGETLTAVLLRDTIDTLDDETGLINDTITQYRFLKLRDGAVTVTIYDVEGTETSRTTLSLDRIPLVVFEISQSLLTDIADYQIALTNIESTDIMYAIKANYPFYVEQYNASADMAALTRSASGFETGDDAGEASEAAIAKDKEIKVGLMKGRRYPIGTEPPSFIHPSSEPLSISMAKQEQLKHDIRRLVNLNLSDLQPQRVSAESKQQDEKTLEAGLSYIGMELEFGERQIANIWALYESSTVATVSYPENYSLKSDAAKRAEAKQDIELIPKIPSKTFQRALAKEAARKVIGSKVTNDELNDIFNEIDAADILTIDPEIIISEHEAGFVSTEYASKILGYPSGQVDQAKIDHADRASRIALAQSEAGARGVADMSNDPNAAVDEKKRSE